MKRMKTFRLNRRRTAGLGALLAICTMIAFVPQAAWADDPPPTSMELLDACNNTTDLCEFHPSGPLTNYWTTADLVGQTANCTDRDQNASISWETSTFTTNSFGTSFKFTAGASKAYLFGFKIAYQHDWTDTVTDRDTTKLTVPAGSMGRIFHSREMERASGQYEMHFGSQFHGHYIWYLPMTVDSPMTDGQDGVTTQSTPMTDDERSAYCA